MNILKSKSSKKYLNKIEQNVISRKTKYFRRNVHINHLDTNIRILRIKNDQQFDLDVKGYKTIPDNVCFFIYHMSSNKSLDKYVKPNNDSEFIITNSKTNEIVALNTLKINLPDFVNIWITKKHTIEFLKLKVGDVFFTR